MKLIKEGYHERVIMKEYHERFYESQVNIMKGFTCSVDAPHVKRHKSVL